MSTNYREACLSMPSAPPFLPGEIRGNPTINDRPKSEQSSLYKAQSAGIQEVQKSFTPYFDNKYLEEQSTAVKCLCYVINIFHALACFVPYVFNSVSSLVGHVVVPLLDLICIGETLFPTNPVNGVRRCMLISRSVEKFLGDNLFYPMASSDMWDTRLPEENVGDVNSIVTRMVEADKVNADKVNADKPVLQEGKTIFDYRVRVVDSREANAFACPGGGMILYDQLVKIVAHKAQEIKETTVELSNGERVVVDLRSVGAEDVLAALLGHEMTHIASRHSMAALFLKLITKGSLSITRSLGIKYLKSQNKDLQKALETRSSDKAQSKAVDDDNEAIIKRELKHYASFEEIIMWLEGKVEHLTGLFNSRKDEYEADITGAWLAHNAGFDPRGALLLQHIFESRDMPGFFEPFLTHPLSQNRKRALYAAINSFAPEILTATTYR
jgi:hypothetical protein